MFSIRKLSIVLASPLLLAGVEGCARKGNTPPVATHEPQQVDAAMQLRQWDQSVAYYPNGDAVAGTTLYNYEPARGQKYWQYYYGDSGVFLMNLGLLPYNLFAEPVNASRTYAGETVPPSYTAVSPLPAEAQPMPEAAPETPMEPESPPAPEAPAVEPAPMPLEEPGEPEQPGRMSPPPAPANPLDVAPLAPATQPIQ